MVLGFYAPPTAKVIWRRDLGLKSRPKDRRNLGLNSWALDHNSSSWPQDYKASSKTTTQQRLLSVAVQPGLCRTKSETPKTAFRHDEAHLCYRNTKILNIDFSQHLMTFKKKGFNINYHIHLEKKNWLYGCIIWASSWEKPVLGISDLGRNTNSRCISFIVRWLETRSAPSDLATVEGLYNPSVFLKSDISRR